MPETREMIDGTRIQYIPDNYEEGLNFLGFSIKPSNAIQTVIIVAIPLLIIFLLPIKIKFTIRLIIALCFGIPLMFIGLNGVKGDSLLGYLYHVIKFKKRKRTAYYNPRVKKEAKPSYISDQNDNYVLPKDKLLSLVNKYKNNLSSGKKVEEATNKFDSGVVFFQDDEGIVETKPYEYLSAKERKMLKKQQKKQRNQQHQQNKQNISTANLFHKKNKVKSPVTINKFQKQISYNVDLDEKRKEG